MLKTLKCLFILIAFVGGFEVQAALIDRGGGFIYDDVLDITWLQDADLADGLVSWNQAKALVDTLSIADPRVGYDGVVYDDWRLPSVDVNGLPDFADGLPADCSVVTESGCRDNEFGYMFYHNGVTSGSPGLFTQVNDYVYWSVKYNEFEAYAFDMTDAWTSGCAIDGTIGCIAFVWAVRDGDVGVVPLPAAVWLFSSGLIGLIGVARRKKP